MGVLAATVLLYDFGTRRGSFAGPLLLGLARGVNVLAGYAAAGGADAFSVQTGGGLPVEVLTIAGGYGAAIAGLSLFALAEDQPWSRARAVIAALTSIAGLFAAYAAAAAWKSASASFGAIEPRSACLFASSLFWIPLVEPASIVLGPSRPWTPDRVGQVVGAGLRAIFVFHALILLLAGAPLGAAFCGAGYAAARVLSRWIPPT
jgi:hypothetical protein